MSPANDKQVGGAHYQGARFQHWDWVVLNRLGYLEGQVTKYLSRWRHKGAPVQDLEKALHYAEKLAEVYQSGLHRPYGNRQSVQGLKEMGQLYQLTPTECGVFQVLAEYSSLEELRAVAHCLEHVLTEVRAALASRLPTAEDLDRVAEEATAQANTSTGRYPPSMAGEPPAQ